MAQTTHEASFGPVFVIAALQTLPVNPPTLQTRRASTLVLHGVGVVVIVVVVVFVAVVVVVVAVVVVVVVVFLLLLLCRVMPCMPCVKSLTRQGRCWPLF